MAAIPHPNPNPNLLSPMLQPYLEQQQQFPPGPPDKETATENVNESSLPSINNSIVSNPYTNPVLIDWSTTTLLHVSFNQDYSCFAAGTDRGFRVYNCDPFGGAFFQVGDLKLLHKIETIANPKGLCAVSHVAGSFVLVCPGLQKGQVRVEHFPSNRTKFIMAHVSRIASFTLSQDGNLLATASTKGTLVRFFNTHDGTLLQEVTRGVNRAEIYSLAFSPTAHWLAVSSDKGTIHVFSLKFNAENLGNARSSSPSDSNSAVTSPSSTLSFIKGVLPKYFSSEWSVAQFRLIEGSRYIVAFGHQKNTVIILGLDGRSANETLPYDFCWSKFPWFSCHYH